MAAKKKIDNAKTEKIKTQISSLEEEANTLQNKRNMLRNELNVLEGNEDSELEKKFLTGMKAFQKEIANHVAVIKTARKEIAKLSEKTGYPAYFSGDYSVYSYIPKSFAKKFELSEDILFNISDEYRLDECFHPGWHTSSA